MHINLKNFIISTSVLITGISVSALELTCKTANQKLPHQIEITIKNNIVEINEAWNGPYKTTAHYFGLVIPNPQNFALYDFDFKGVPAGVSDRPYTSAKFIFNYEQNTAKLHFSGFLAPQNNGNQKMNCRL